MSVLVKYVMARSDQQHDFLEELEEHCDFTVTAYNGILDALVESNLALVRAPGVAEVAREEGLKPPKELFVKYTIWHGDVKINEYTIPRDAYIQLELQAGWRVEMEEIDG